MCCRETFTLLILAVCDVKLVARLIGQSEPSAAHEAGSRTQGVQHSAHAAILFSCTRIVRDLPVLRARDGRSGTTAAAGLACATIASCAIEVALLLG